MPMRRHTQSAHTINYYTVCWISHGGNGGLLIEKRSKVTKKLPGPAAAHDE